MKKTVPIAAILVGLTLGSYTSRLLAQQLNEGYVNDNSDWWSLLRNLTNGDSVNPGTVAISPANFRIMSIGLEYDDLFKKVQAKLEPAKEAIRGDAAFARNSCATWSSKPAKLTSAFIADGPLGQALKDFGNEFSLGRSARF
jgi:hypothetical protein